MTTDRIETVIVGGGQAGLSTSYWLKQLGKEHLVLDKADRPGHAWRQRWDSFTLVTPNWTFRLPGAEYRGDDPDGFMPRDAVVACFEHYAADHGLPVVYGADVTVVEPLAGRAGYRVRTRDAGFEVRNVVVATGLYQRARIPAFAADLPADILQMHSEQYRSPTALPPGAVLVVGSGQSGCQIAEELRKSGRTVFLSVGSAGRGPRRYRGKDVFEWLALTGFLDRTPDKLPSPQARFAANPHVSGAGGGHDLNLHQFARDGITLLGHLCGAANCKLGLAPDLKEGLAKADAFASNLITMIDDYVARVGLEAPEERLPDLRDGYAADEITELDLADTGITSMIWAAGYRFDFSLVQLPVTDGDGFPVQQRGITAHPGLYFVGMPWLHTAKSSLLLGVGEDAEFIAQHIARRKYA